MADDRKPTPSEQVRALYEDGFTAPSASLGSFGELLAWTAENVVAVAKIGVDAFDLVLRNLRMASRADVTRLSRQISRTEDKLELVLQEVERLRSAATNPNGHRSARARGRRGGGSR
jgi:hypothetical protein